MDLHKMSRDLIVEREREWFGDCAVVTMQLAVDAGSDAERFHAVEDRLAKVSPKPLFLLLIEVVTSDNVFSRL